MGSYRLFRSEDLAPLGPSRSGEESGLRGLLTRSCGYIFILVGIVAMSLISWGQLTMWSEISALREEVEILKLHVLWYSADDNPGRILQPDSSDAIPRAKRSPPFRQEGDPVGSPKPPVFDFPYASGNDVNQHDSASSLMKYGSLMHGRTEHQSPQQRFPTVHDALAVVRPRVQQRPRSQSQSKTTSGDEGVRHASKSGEDKRQQMSAYARRVNAHRLLRTSYTPAAAAAAAASTSDFSDNFISRSPVSSTEAPAITSRPITKSLIGATNSIELVGDADKGKEEVETVEGTNHSDAKSRVALHLFESQSAPPSSDLLGNVGGWQRSLESGVTATEVDEDGRVIVPEDGLYLLYAQVRYRADKRHGPTNAYEVYHDAKSILTCSKSAESASEQSCFTARVLMARRGDTLSLRDKSAGNRISIDSFLGIVKL